MQNFREGVKLLLIVKGQLSFRGLIVIVMGGLCPESLLNKFDSLPNFFGFKRHILGRSWVGFRSFDSEGPNTSLKLTWGGRGSNKNCTGYLEGQSKFVGGGSL